MKKRRTAEKGQQRRLNDMRLAKEVLGLRRLSSDYAGRVGGGLFSEFLRLAEAEVERRRIVRHYRARRTHILAHHRLRAVMALGLMKLRKV